MSDQLPLSEAPLPPPTFRASPFFLPLWSLLLMLLCVGAVVFAGVAALYAVGGRIPSISTPQVQIATAPPERLQADATPLGVSGFLQGAVPSPNFVLSGPTLAPVYLTPTPDVITLGRTVLVVNVGESGLNVRQTPGINSELLFTARENSLLEVIDGPRAAENDGFTWWQVRDPFTQQAGWAVDIYMQVQPLGGTTP
ncbi:MAG: SH3 domain-containing protein [Phototrophicaceae bacterium]